MNIIVDTSSVADDCGGVGEERKVALPFNDAVAVAVGAAFAPALVEPLSLAESVGRILGGDITAPAALPRFDHSAMDGYAVRTEDFVGTGPWALRVASRIAAGDHPIGVGRDDGAVVEIFTGAPVPPGFDAVVIRERSSRLGPDGILIAARPQPGENIRRAGEDVGQGTTIAYSGATISAHLAALFAALGVTSVSVRPKIRIAVLTTGSELRRPGETLEPGQIYDSNSYMAAGMLSQPWIEYTDLGRIPDDLRSITEAVCAASDTCDVLITSGGMSHGAADHVRAALEACDARLEVLNVAMRPGKPATFGRVGRALFIGLPGNPMAAAVALRQIALPAIRKTAGIAMIEAPWATAVSGFEYNKREGRTEFVPVAIVERDPSGRPVLERLGLGSSGSLLPMARADGLARLEHDQARISVGDQVRFESFHSY